ncbi:DUF6602 domain-containing protein [Paenibacillus validus]|uniref:DUF6602 domain-containing protein n=1 Tax=Paenibacillus validus TaxID=44253 RepID=UPI003D2CB9AC
MIKLPNYLEYQKSVAKEFKAYEKRVRNLIDNAHFAEEGRYKEIILMNYLKRVLPKNLSVGTGFVRNGDRLTSQIDVIIYDNSFPLLFSEGDFIIATPKNVIGIIEIKTNIASADICDIVEKSNSNGAIISGGNDLLIFNGIFAFNSNNRIETYIEKLNNYDFSPILELRHFNEILPNALFSCVNHISLGDKYFFKLWQTGQNDQKIEPPYYSVYNLEESLAFAYFLSNIQDFMIRRANGNGSGELPKDMQSFFYPLPEGKEARLLDRIYLEKN